MLFLDFEKAFDSVEWNFLFKVLKKFNIGKNFITWANILYTNPIFIMKNYGWLSKLKIQKLFSDKGNKTRMSFISSLLFLFVAEILAIKIKNHQNINGIKINIYEIKSKQHAEFSYKHLNNILCNNAYVSKWKKETSNQYVHCKQIENIKHLLFECDNVKSIWNAVSNFLSFKTQWKHIVVGFFL